MRCCIQHIIQVHGEDTLLKHFDEVSTSCTDNSDHDNSTMKLLLNGVFTFLGEIPLVYVKLLHVHVSCVHVIGRINECY